MKTEWIRKMAQEWKMAARVHGFCKDMLRNNQITNKTHTKKPSWIIKGILAGEKSDNLGPKVEIT